MMGKTMVSSAEKFQRNGRERRNPFFTRAQDQLKAAMICCENGRFDLKRSIPISFLADRVSKTNTPSRANKCSFKQISFHVKLTFGV